ncbi:hypothetical protein [uncultured Bacteroides sp.]|nr:hypothetical protein [uncultured Bacteroides sp.]
MKNRTMPQATIQQHPENCKLSKLRFSSLKIADKRIAEARFCLKRSL